MSWHHQPIMRCSTVFIHLSLFWWNAWNVMTNSLWRKGPLARSNTLLVGCVEATCTVHGMDWLVVHPIEWVSLECCKSFITVCSVQYSCHTIFVFIYYFWYTVYKLLFKGALIRKCCGLCSQDHAFKCVLHVICLRLGSEWTWTA